MRAGVQFDRRQVQFEQAHVLDDQRVGAGFVALPDQPPGFFQFVVLEQGIDRDQNAGIEAVCVAGQPFDIGNRVAGIYARAKSRAADIQGIGAVTDRFNTEFGILGRGQEFQGVAIVGHGVVLQQRRLL